MSANETRSADEQRELPSGGSVVDGAASFAAMQSAFEKARSGHPALVREFNYAFAGRRVQVRTVGKRLGESAGRSLAHLMIADGAQRQQSLTIDLWDESETGVGWRMEAERDGLGIDHWFAVSTDRRFVVQERLHELTWLDRQAGQIVGWTVDARQFNLAERARVAYFPVLLWLNDQGLRLVHGGLVGQDDRGVVIMGESGQGKSTAVLTCLSAGMHSVADDHLWLEKSAGGGFVGHGLYASCNLRPHHAERFPSLVEHAIKGKPPAEDKLLVFLSPLFPNQIKPSLRIAALALPRVIDADISRIRQADKTEALLTAVPSSVTDWSFSRMPGRAERFAAIAELIDTVPCFHLEMGRDLADIPCCVREILKESLQP